MTLGGVNYLQLDPRLPIPHKMGSRPIPAFGEAHKDKSWPLSVGAGEAKQLKQHYQFPSHSEENNRAAPRGHHSEFDSVGSVLLTGMEDYCRIRVLSGCDSEHRIKDGRKAKRSLGPVPCLYVSLPRQMVVILHLKISRAASHSALGSTCFPLTIKKFFPMF